MTNRGRNGSDKRNGSGATNIGLAYDWGITQEFREYVAWGSDYGVTASGCGSGICQFLKRFWWRLLRINIREDLSIEWKSSVGRGVTGALALSAFFVGSLRNGAGIVPYPSVKRERGAPFPFRVQGGASKRVGQLRKQILNESRMGEYSAQTPLCRGMHPSGIIHTSP